MDITIKKDRKERRIVNFWNNLHFHPTDAIEENWGRSIIDKISKDKVARLIRVYSMFEDIVYLDLNEKMQYNFMKNDYRLDYLVEKGFELLICFNYMPPALAENPNHRSPQPRYKNKGIVFSKPRSYGQW